MGAEDVVATTDIHGISEYDTASTRWYYLGEDKLEHGPYSNKEMMRWVDCGYFSQGLMIRTERDENFNTLFAYCEACNGMPFKCGIYTLEPQTNRSTPLPVHYPMMILPQPPGMVASSQFQSQGAPSQMYVGSNGFAIPGTGNMYYSGQNGFDSYGLQTNGYGNERENPSSSSVSDSPDIDRCLQVEDLRAEDKCVGTEDAPWLMPSARVDSGTDAPIFALNTTSAFTQTQPVAIKSNQVARLLKELTGVSFYIR